MKKVVGVLGGMGPQATVNFLQKIICYTNADKDQEHIPMIIDNNVRILDRTAYILNRGKSPLSQLLYSAKRLEDMGAEVLVMPCNTAHSFYNEIKQEINIPFINMVEETVRHLLKYYASEVKVGLLATLGTCKMGLYEKALNSNSIDVMSLNEEEQSNITEIIYEVKKGNILHKQTVMLETLKNFKADGCNLILLGCTELPIYFNELMHTKSYKEIDIKVIDSMDILARKVVKYATID